MSQFRSDAEGMGGDETSESKQFLTQVVGKDRDAVKRAFEALLRAIAPVKDVS